MRYFDSHAHLTSDALYPEMEAILDRAASASVEHIVNICTGVASFERGLQVAKAYSGKSHCGKNFPFIHNVASTTPHDVEKEGELFFPIVAEAAKRGELKAVGESGLDYFYYAATAELQQHYLRRYLELALECRLPIVIHCREAFADLFKILDSHYVKEGRHAPGVLHCFTGTLSEAREVIARGWYVSLSGIVTFKKSSDLQEIAKEIPLESLLIETDSPYLAPQKQRGKRNEPCYIAETASCIAALKGIPTEMVAAVTRENGLSLFNL